MGRLSAFHKNPCPFSAGIAVRFAQESVSGISRNECPLCARICMQLSYFTEIGFLKLVYFFVDLDSGMGKIAKIKTHSTKFLVDSPNTKRSVRKIQELLGKIKTL